MPGHDCWIILNSEGRKSRRAGWTLDRWRDESEAEDTWFAVDRRTESVDARDVSETEGLRKVLGRRSNGNVLLM